MVLKVTQALQAVQDQAVVAMSMAAAEVVELSAVLLMVLLVL